LFIAGMICDYWPATWNGNVYYGFNKRFASMTATATAFHAPGDGNTRGFHATVGGNGRSNDAASLDWIRHVVKLPVLGRRDDGSWVRSSFDWRFDAAIVEPVTVDIDVTAPFAELPGGRYSDADGTAAACRVRGMRWCLSWPAPAMK
jgi:hypothetical protein